MDLGSEGEHDQRQQDVGILLSVNQLAVLVEGVAPHIVYIGLAPVRWLPPTGVNKT